MYLKNVVMGSSDMVDWVPVAEFDRYDDALAHLAQVVTFQYWKIETIWSYPF
jgi:hypothetical protein